MMLGGGLTHYAAVEVVVLFYIVVRSYVDGWARETLVGGKCGHVVGIKGKLWWVWAG
jgi:hypothetical protein